MKKPASFILFLFLFTFSFSNISAQSNKKVTVERLIQNMLGVWEVDIENSDFDSKSNIVKLQYINKPLEYGIGLETKMTYVYANKEGENIKFSGTTIYAFDEASEQLHTFIYNSAGMVTQGPIEIYDDKSYKTTTKNEKEDIIDNVIYDGAQMTATSEEYDKNGNPKSKSVLVMRKVK